MSIGSGDAYGVNSGTNVPPMTTAASDPFDIVPVRVSEVEFVSSAGTVSVDSTLSTDSNVALLKITADNWTCSDMTGGDLDLHITNIVLNETLGNFTSVGSYEIIKTSNQQDQP